MFPDKPVDPLHVRAYLRSPIYMIEGVSANARVSALANHPKSRNTDGERNFHLAAGGYRESAVQVGPLRRSRPRQRDARSSAGSAGRRTDPVNNSSGPVRAFGRRGSRGITAPRCPPCSSFLPFCFSFCLFVVFSLLCFWNS